MLGDGSALYVLEKDKRNFLGNDVLGNPSIPGSRPIRSRERQAQLKNETIHAGRSGTVEPKGRGDSVEGEPCT